MARGDSASLDRGIRALFGESSIVGLSDGQLLARFAERPRGDPVGEAAFEALMARHGPMVFQVCRATLGDPDAAQDAFQATFLVLARRAGTIRRRDTVAGWLHGVARRSASVLRRETIRRRAREHRAAAERPEQHDWQPHDDTGPILHDELDRLPARYRDPIVLFHLEGLSQEAVAQRLGWPIGTVRTRLSRGRDRLRKRLIRRGLAPSAALAAITFPAHSVTASTKTIATGATSRWFSQNSSHAHQIAEGVCRAMTMTRSLHIASLGLLTIGLATAGGVLAARQGTEPAGPIPQAPREKPNSEAPSQPKQAAPPHPTTQTIRKALEHPAPNDPKPVTLEGFLKRMKADTIGPELPNGVLIYIEPAALDETHNTLLTKVINDLEGITWSTALRRVLKPIGLAYVVRDGLLMISSQKLLVPLALDDSPQTRAALARLRRSARVIMQEQDPESGGISLGHLIEILKREILRDDGPDVPVVIDPDGLIEAGLTLDSPLQLAPGPAGDTFLRRLLNRAGLNFVAKDGRLIISSEAGIKQLTRDTLY